MSTQGTFGTFVPTEEIPQDTPPIDVSKVTVNDAGDLVPPSDVPPIDIPPTGEQPPVDAPPPAEENSSTFVFDIQNDEPLIGNPNGDAPPTSQPQATSWQEAIKGVDRKELLRAAGVSDFALEMDEHIAKGGQPSDYISAKGIDWTKVGDEDILKADFQQKYSYLSPEDLNLLYNQKYGVNDPDDETEVRLKSIERQAGAHEIRQKKIAEQASFKIPEIAKKSPELDEIMQQMEAGQRQAELQRQQNVQFIAEHEATKNLMTSKRVAVSLGKDGDFNFNVPDTEALMKPLTDSGYWARLTSTKTGEPDVAKQFLLSLVAHNPIAFVQDIYNYGKSRGLKQTLVDEGQNAKRPVGATPLSASQEVSVANKDSRGFGSKN